jgi:hypothetical protein
VMRQAPSTAGSAIVASVNETQRVFDMASSPCSVRGPARFSLRAR